MMWPTDELAAAAAADPDMMAIAKTTVYGLNNYTGFTFAGSKTPWANNNGFGLSWPPAVRVSEGSDAEQLLQLMATAAVRQTSTNGIVKTGGGCLENMGATAAINEMLLQSYTGVLRVFPVWSKDVGPASFEALRARGAFIVSASMDIAGNVSPIIVVSEQGTSPCVFESPLSWGVGVPAVRSAGATVPVSKRSDGAFEFSTTAGATYTISTQ